MAGRSPDEPQPNRGPSILLASPPGEGMLIMADLEE